MPFVSVEPYYMPKELDPNLQAQAIQAAQALVVEKQKEFNDLMEKISDYLKTNYMGTDGQDVLQAIKKRLDQKRYGAPRELYDQLSNYLNCRITLSYDLQLMARPLPSGFKESEADTAKIVKEQKRIELANQLRNQHRDALQADLKRLEDMEPAYQSAIKDLGKAKKNKQLEHLNDSLEHAFDMIGKEAASSWFNTFDALTVKPVESLCKSLKIKTVRTSERLEGVIGEYKKTLSDSWGSPSKSYLNNLRAVITAHESNVQSLHDPKAKLQAPQGRLSVFNDAVDGECKEQQQMGMDYS
jgi:hypothetical protein